MKSVYSILNAFIIMTLTGCQNSAGDKFRKAEVSEIDQERLEFAVKLSDDILEAQKNGGFYELSNSIADPKMISGLNEGVQKSSYQQLKSLFGDYESLEFDHMMLTTVEPSYEIYRFKGTFNSSDAPVEVRTVLNPDGKLSGFFVKPWKESL